MRASKAAREYLQWASEKHRVECDAQRAVGRRPSAASRDTTSGCGANPTVGDAFDKLYDAGLHAGVRRDLRDHRRREDRRRRAAATTRCAPTSCACSTATRTMINRHKTTDLSESQPTKGNIAGGLTTIEEKALGNIQKIGKQVRRRRRARQGRDADAPGPVVHGLELGGGRDGDAVRGVRLRRALLPDRAGQRDRQPDPAGHQDLREPAHGAPDERARRRRHVGPAAARDHDRARPATSCST